MIWFNIFGIPYLLFGITLLLSLLYVVRIDTNLAALLAVSLPALLACILDRVPKRRRFVHFQTFSFEYEIRQQPGMRVAVFMGPVALWCIPAAVLYPIGVMGNKQSVFQSTLTLYFLVATGVNLLVFFATLPLRVYDATAASKTRREVSRASRKRVRGGVAARSAAPPVTKTAEPLSTRAEIAPQHERWKEQSNRKSEDRSDP